MDRRIHGYLIQSINKHGEEQDEAAATTYLASRNTTKSISDMHTTLNYLQLQPSITILSPSFRSDYSQTPLRPQDLATQMSVIIRYLSLREGKPRWINALPPLSLALGQKWLIPRPVRHLVPIFGSTTAWLSTRCGRIHRD